MINKETFYCTTGVERPSKSRIYLPRSFRGSNQLLALGKQFFDPPNEEKSGPIRVNSKTVSKMLTDDLVELKIDEKTDLKRRATLIPRKQETAHGLYDSLDATCVKSPALFKISVSIITKRKSLRLPI